MAAPHPGPPPEQLAAAIDALRLQVTPDTVLQVRAALLAEARRLQSELQFNAFEEGVGLCGGDPVSPDAARAFNERIATLISHCVRHVSDLEEIGKALAGVARRYGFTEAEITASYDAS